jgi:3-deoxy-7-phosphoheptulonate synthase
VATVLTTPAPQAPQQPTWVDPWLADRVRRELEAAPMIARPEDILLLGERLAEVAAGQRQVLQAGDCAERPTDCVPSVLSRKLDQIEALATVMTWRSGLPTERVGRIAGQFAKPRSAPYETIGEVQLPVFRGMMINGATADLGARFHDPLRLLHAHSWSARGAAFLDSQAGISGCRTWTSHEALVLDYEMPLLRRHTDGRSFLTSTHWPWIGDRTRDPDGAHVSLLAAVANPVAVKVGPGISTETLLKLCERLDPDRTPGRLTLIARLGSEDVRVVLPPLLSAVRDAGHPVIWLCDPMHANTVLTPRGLKTRYVDRVREEVVRFGELTGEAGVHAGGLHLEATPFQVRECVATSDEAGHLTSEHYTSLCDPRLNPAQALAVAQAWGGAA